MSLMEAIVHGPEPVEHRKSYEKPTLTTFGSVAKLTMASRSGSYNDNSGVLGSSRTTTRPA